MDGYGFIQYESPEDAKDIVPSQCPSSLDHSQPPLMCPVPCRFPWQGLQGEHSHRPVCPWRSASPHSQGLHCWWHRRISCSSQAHPIQDEHYWPSSGYQLAGGLTITPHFCCALDFFHSPLGPDDDAFAHLYRPLPLILGPGPGFVSPSRWACWCDSL